MLSFLRPRLFKYFYLNFKIWQLEFAVLKQFQVLKFTNYKFIHLFGTYNYDKKISHSTSFETSYEVYFIVAIFRDG